MLPRRLIICCLVLIAELSLSAAGKSEATNGLYLVIDGWRQGVGTLIDKPITSSDKLTFMAFFDPGKIELLMPLDPAYGIKIRAYDAIGNAIIKTGAGEKYGSKYNQLVSVETTRVGVWSAWGSYASNPGLGGGKSLPSPRELFVFPKPGFYSLEIEMQMFRVNTNTWVKTLQRFPPVTLKIEAPK